MAKAEKVRCSWCGQEIKGRRLRFRKPGGSTVFVCRHCSMGWAGVLAYGAGLVGELTRKPRVTFQSLFGRNAGHAFGSVNHRSAG